MIGAWTVVAPWVVLGSHVSAGTVVSNVIAGAVIVVVGIVTTMTAGRRPDRR